MTHVEGVYARKQARAMRVLWDALGWAWDEGEWIMQTRIGDLLGGRTVKMCPGNWVKQRGPYNKGK